jgi:hypothetical protein
MEGNYKEDNFLEAQIMAYINGSLEGQALTDFEEQMRQNPHIAEDVLFQKRLKFALLNKETIQASQNMSNWLKNNPLSPNPETLWDKAVKNPLSKWVVGLSISIAIGFVTYKVIDTPSVSGLEKPYFRHYGTHRDMTSGDKTLMAYNDSIYGQAIEPLKTYLDTQGDKLDMRLYLGISYLGNQEYKKAIKQLKLVEKQITEQDIYLKIPTFWYLALAHLANNDKSQAITYLQKLQNDAEYGQQAQALLEKLR